MRYVNFFRLFGIILFIYILAKIDIAELVTTFKEINPIYYLLCILFSILGFLIRVGKWQILTNSIGAEISFWQLAKISAKGFFWGLVTPGKLGEFWKVKYLSENTRVSGGRAFYTALLDRLLDILVILVIGTVGLAVLPIILFYFLIKKSSLGKVPQILINFLLPDFLKGRADSFLAEFYQGFAGLKLKLFLKVLVLAFLYYLLAGPILHYFLALALGITIPFWYLFLTVAIVWLILMIPISVFGFGTREASFIYFFSILGIPASLAVAFSLLVLLANILLALPGVILVLRRR